jgi:PAS domain S-box-containing protein
MTKDPSPDRAGTSRSWLFMGSSDRLFARYAVAVVVVGLGFLLRLPFAGDFGSRIPYVTLSPAVMLAAVLGGFGPGLLATNLATLGAAFWILTPTGQFKIENWSDIVGLALFMGTGVFMSAVAGLYRETRGRAAAYDREQAIRETEERIRTIANVPAPPPPVSRPESRPPMPMGQFKRRLLLDVAFALAIGLLAGVGAASYRTMTATREAELWEQHSYTVISELDDLLQSLQSVETGQRGFLITGDVQSLRPYTGALGQVDRHLDALRTLTIDNPRQQRRLAEIESLIHRDLAELRESIALRSAKGFEAASDAMKAGRGEPAMAEIHQKVELAQEEEAQLLKNRIAAKEASASATIRWVVIGATLGGAGLLLVYVFFKIEFVRRRRIEQELRVYQDHLRDLVNVRTLELQASEERMRVTLTSIGDAVLVGDAESRVTFLNPVAVALTGWRTEEAQGQPVRSVFKIINGQTRRPAVDIVESVLREKRAVALANHTALVAKDGREIPIEDSAAPILDAAGNVTGVVLVFHDVTEKRLVQEELAESRERLEIALASSEMAPFEWDIANNKRTWGEGVHRLLGTTPETFRGTAEEFFQAIHPDDRSATQAALTRAVDTTAYETEYRVVWPDGSIHHIAARGRVHRDSQGRAVRLAGICWDITARKQTEEILRFLGESSGTGSSEDFFLTLATTLARILGMEFVCIDRLDDELLTARTLAVFHDGRFEDNVSYALKDTPCGDVVGKSICCFPRDVRRLFPMDAVLQDLQAESYVGTTLYGPQGKPIGLIAVIGRNPLVDMRQAESIMRIAGVRAAGELERQEAEAALRRSEERYRNLVDVSPNAIFVNRNNRIVLVNPAALQLFGATAPEQVLGKTPFDLFHPDYHEGIRGRMRRLEGGEKIVLIEEKIVRLDGLVVDVEVAASRFQDQEGPADQVILRDVTERKRQEEQLRKLNRTLQALSRSSQVLVRATDETAFLRDVCRLIVDECGHAMVWIGFAEEDEARSIRPVASAGFEAGYLETLKLTWADTERGRGPTGTAIRTAKPSQCANMHTDPKFALWREEAVKRGYASSLALPLLTAEKAFGAITIYSREPDPFSDAEVSLLSGLADDLAFGVVALRLRVARQQAEKALEQERRDLERKVDERTGQLQEFNAQLIAEMDMRKEKEAELRAAEFRFRTVAEFTQDWEYWETPEHTLRYCSPSCEGITGYSSKELVADPGLMERMIHPEDMEIWRDHRQDACTKSRAGIIQFRIRRKGGGIRWIEHACQPVLGEDGAYLGIRAGNRDVTARRDAELETQRLRYELAHVTRVTTLGQLAASLAHELNQPLGAILCNAEAAQSLLAAGRENLDEARGALGDIIEDDQRAGHVIRRLRAMFRKEAVERQPLDVNDLVRDTLVLLRSELVIKNVAAQLDLAPGLPLVAGGRVELQQVVMNLVLNAADAMAGQESGRRSMRVLTSVDGSRWVRVSVSDSGPGLPAELIAERWEPFFTTKPGGMGMGLSISRSIIESHGGRLWAVNNPDRGATFHFALPVIEGSSA